MASKGLEGEKRMFQVDKAEYEGLQVKENMNDVVEKKYRQELREGKVREEFTEAGRERLVENSLRDVRGHGLHCPQQCGVTKGFIWGKDLITFWFE